MCEEREIWRLERIGEISIAIKSFDKQSKIFLIAPFPICKKTCDTDADNDTKTLCMYHR